MISLKGNAVMEIISSLWRIYKEIILPAWSQILDVSSSGLALKVQRDNSSVGISGVQIFGHDEQFFVGDGSCNIYNHNTKTYFGSIK